MPKHLQETEYDLIRELAARGYSQNQLAVFSSRGITTIHRCLACESWAEYRASIPNRADFEYYRIAAQANFPSVFGITTDLKDFKMIDNVVLLIGAIASIVLLLNLGI